MKREFSTVAIIGRVDDSRVSTPMRALAAHLSNTGITVIANANVAAAMPVKTVDDSTLAESADLIIAVGGDGTILRAANLARCHERPILGINRGRLGFLADISPSEMLTSLDRVLQGDYTKESRLLLDAAIHSPEGEPRTATALNDVVLQRRESGRMIDFETRVAGRYVNTHAGDGLIVTTPTGSTAYSLSCGGPIIEPTLDVVAVVPVCPHTLSDRPIVVPASRQIDVVLLPRGETPAEVIVDGRRIGELAPTDRLSICAAAQRITLLHPPGHDFYDILRSKLHWGRDSRQRSAEASADD